MRGGVDIDESSDLRKYLVLLQDALAIKFVQGKKKEEEGKERKKELPEEGISRRSSLADESLRGICLFKEFLAANEPCTIWNPELKDALANLECKGVILPTTFLVGVASHLEDDIRPIVVIKQAYAKKILRGPPGFSIGFVGEIDEVLADSVNPCNFIPLSDSICWAIHELTSAGQEAFVDVILGELKTSYPDTAPPPKEILYKVLEHLVQSRKVYQTPNGYYIHGGPQEKDKDDAGSAITSTSSLNRSNSLRSSLRRQHSKVIGCLGFERRSFTLRPKKKPKEVKGTQSVTSSVKGSGSDLTLDKESLVFDKRKKHQSFLKNWLFRRSSTSSTPGGKLKGSFDPSFIESKLETSKEISTQTSESLENLQTDFKLLSVCHANRNLTDGSQLSSLSPIEKDRSQDSDSGRFTEISESDAKRQSPLSLPSSGIPPSSMSHTSPSSIASKDEDELRRLMSPTPTSCLTTPVPPSYVSSSSYLLNNPYRRRYLSYLNGTGSPSNYKSLSLHSSAPTPNSLLLPRYPPRPFEKRQIYDRLTSAKQMETKRLLSRTLPPKISIHSVTTPTATTTTTTTVQNISSSNNSSNVQVEVLLPLGKLINKVMTDFDQKNGQEEDRNRQGGPKAAKDVSDLFSFQSTMHTKTKMNATQSEVDVDVKFTTNQETECKSPDAPLRTPVVQSSPPAVETISYKPAVRAASADYKESAII